MKIDHVKFLILRVSRNVRINYFEILKNQRSLFWEFFWSPYSLWIYNILLGTFCFFPFSSQSRCETKRMGGEKLNICRDSEVPGSNLAWVPFLFRFHFVFQLLNCLTSYGRGNENGKSIALPRYECRWEPFNSMFRSRNPEHNSDANSPQNLGM